MIYNDKNLYKRYIKRLLDIVLSITALIVLAIPMLIIATVIKLDSDGPALFRQRRIGIHKREFIILKFRTMYTSASPDVPTHKLNTPEKWITHTGAFLRKTSLDELPQLINILAGQMSFVGPRPALWNQNDLIMLRDRFGANDIKPGLTGLAQISGRDLLDITEKARLDGEYVRRLGFLFDLRCCIITVFNVLARRGISDITDERTHYICSDHVNTTKEEVPPSVKCSPVKELASIDGGFFSSFPSALKSTAETLYGGALPPIETQMTNSKFSVLMSVYNKEKPEYLDLALKSNLENQTLKPNEMILICDGVLTEELYNVISKYEMKYSGIFKVFRLTENVGLGRALRFGLEKCKYELIARSDSDDICVSERFEIQINFLEKHPEIDIVGSYIDEFKCCWNSPDRVKTLPLTHEKLVKLAKFRNPVNHMSAMFRKSSIISAGSYMHLPCAEDYFLWVRAICGGSRIANIDKILVHARIGNGMELRRGDRAYINSWKMLDRYMLEKSMINRFEYILNMIAVRWFVYMPPILKRLIYKTILRKSP